MKLSVGGFRLRNSWSRFHGTVSGFKAQALSSAPICIATAVPAIEIKAQANRCNTFLVMDLPWNKLGFSLNAAGIHAVADEMTGVCTDLSPQYEQ